MFCVVNKFSKLRQIKTPSVCNPDQLTHPTFSPNTTNPSHISDIF